MTPERLDALLNLLGIGTRTLAAVMDIDDRNIRRWVTGRRKIPPDASEWLDKLDHLLRNPPKRAREPAGSATERECDAAGI